MNLLQETLDVLKECKKTPSDVLFITDGKADCSWKDFIKIADFEYDDGFGSPEINHLLAVVGNNWWLERCEYDRSESWSFKTKPISHFNKKPVLNLREEW